MQCTELSHKVTRHRLVGDAALPHRLVSTRAAQMVTQQAMADRSVLVLDFHMGRDMIHYLTLLVDHVGLLV